MATTKKKKPSAGPKCECGGTFKPTKLHNFDFSRHAGIPATLDGAPGWQCSSCEREILLGNVINASLFFIAMDIVGKPYRLPPELARYLRRTMQITQQELADRMGVDRVTVANWESGAKEISSQHDFILRVLMLNTARGSEALPHKTVVEIASNAMAALSGVKSEPPRKASSLRVTAEEFKKLPPTSSKMTHHTYAS